MGVKSIVAFAVFVMLNALADKVKALGALDVFMVPVPVPLVVKLQLPIVVLVV